MKFERKAKADVLLVGPLPPPPLLGGIETGVALQLESDVANQVSICLFNTAREKDPNRSIWEKLAFQVTACLRFVVTVARVNPSVVHIKAASGINFYQNALYVFLSRAMGRWVLLQLHAGDFPSFYREAGGVGRMAIRAGLRLPHGLIALSPRWSEFFESISGARSIAIIPNATRTSHFARALANRPRFGIPGSSVVLLFVGTRSVEMDREKGLNELVEAVARVRVVHPGLTLVIAGRFSHAESLKACLGTSGAAWVEVGEVHGHDKPALYRSADLFVLPSRFENMPNSVVEAMAAGLPVIATSVGALPEMIEDGRTGFLVPPGDPEALANRIERLVSDPNLRRRLGAAAAETAAREYDLSVLERRLLDQYYKLASSRLPPRKPVQDKC